MVRAAVAERDDEAHLEPWEQASALAKRKRGDESGARDTPAYGPRSSFPGPRPDPVREEYHADETTIATGYTPRFVSAPSIEDAAWSTIRTKALSAADEETGSRGRRFALLFAVGLALTLGLAGTALVVALTILGLNAE